MECEPTAWMVFTRVLAAAMGLFPTVLVMVGFFVWRSLRDDRLMREREERQHEREQWEARSQGRPW
jgi:hypothetical protein